MGPLPPFEGTVLVVAPHMDDETLGCGALLASAPWRQVAHVAFATDGARSPECRGRMPRGGAELIALREQEAVEAMAVLGLPSANVHFLRLPDGRLAHHQSFLRDRLVALATRLAPSCILVPFRYDRHPDHLAVNRVATTAVCDGTLRAALVEYFVYMKWRLLPSGDVRAYLMADHVVEVEPSVVAAQKRRALECYRTQTTRFYDWQWRPILTPALLDAVCNEPEVFLFHDPSLPGAAVFDRARTWIPIAHRLEPVLKRSKDRVVEWLSR